MRERELDWEGCLNVRDLGGHPTEDGATTLYRRVVRADSVRQLSAAGWDAALAYGVRTVVDLRFASELTADPPSEAPIRVVHVSLFGHEDPEGWAEVERRVAHADPLEEKTRLYLAALERERIHVAAALRAVADAPPGGVVIHCAGGKDRTGLLSALLLRVAGVGPQSVADDYALSEARLAPRTARWLEEAEDEATRARLERIVTTPAAAMLSVLERLERRHGSAAGYLAAAGVDGDVLARARARLRE